MKLAQPRLGDAGVQAILELVGQNDRVKAKSAKPAFVEETSDEKPEAEEASDDPVAEAQADASEEPKTDEEE